MKGTGRWRVRPGITETPWLWGDDLLATLIRQPVTAGAAGRCRARTQVDRAAVGRHPAVGQSLLVSAAAGSGKTAMLSERCATSSATPPEPHRCDVDELLVVTFTEKAAAEMKSRINAALRARGARAAPSERLHRQLALAEQAQVSTLHSFCSRLLRQHFHLRRARPGLRRHGRRGGQALQLEVAREMFDQHYELDEAGEFQRLVDSYADGDDERLVRQVIRTHEMLHSLVDPEQWLDETRRELAEAAESGVASELGAELMDLLGRRLAALHGTRRRRAGSLSRAGRRVPRLRRPASRPAAGAEALEEVAGGQRTGRVAQEVKNVAIAQAAAGIQAARRTRRWPRRRSTRSATSSRSGPWRDSLRFTADEWRDGMRRTLPHAEVYLGLVEGSPTCTGPEGRGPATGFLRPGTVHAGRAARRPPGGPAPLADRPALPPALQARAGGRVPGHQRTAGRDPQLLSHECLPSPGTGRSQSRTCSASAT